MLFFAISVLMMFLAVGFAAGTEFCQLFLGEHLVDLYTCAVHFLGYLCLK